MRKAPNLKRPDFIMTAHLQHAWDRALFERLDPHLSIERERRVFSLISTCDPTEEGKYQAWLSNWRRRSWVVAGLRHVCSPVELAEVREALSRFASIQRHLHQDKRDVNKYRGASDLMSACSDLPPRDLRGLRAAERTAALAGTQILFDDGVWKLLKLLDCTAAQWWGKGTRWCTSSKLNNRFSWYAHRGDLMVMVTPRGKFQLFIPTGEFKDAADRHAALSAVLRSAPASLQALVERYSGP